MAGPHHVTAHDAAAFSDADIAVGAALFNRFESEVWPEDPTTPLANVLARARAVPERIEQVEFRAWVGGDLVGSAEVSIDRQNDDDLDVLSCRIFVRAEIRTGNADSNDAMLAIDRAMGYRPLYAVETWELELAGPSVAPGPRPLGP